ncbi:hypothetical protein M413DRAFT_443299 [Hebeloma cylindrosporum]|uniref:Golgi apparatus membrane protein TVP38 n=1 Tax=Hebeloma cylindrosporum TaxID=76867 RepID=A0A0C3CJK5_HEBCY|nr:hypothetical protein M413DRAFT_443299 [Hebeloma cylindrosporum h7]
MSGQQPSFAAAFLYPPQQNVLYPAMNSTSSLETKVAEDPRQISRTPSPTPSELKELKTGAIDWKTLRTKSFWFRREWLWYYVIVFVLVVITALVTIFHRQIVEALTPVTKWLYGLKFGWAVPIAVLFVISFPPLFGHEIVAILCGLVWGLWVGFGIVAAGTFLGEVGNFYAFKYCCRSRGEKLERTKIPYACLARVVRDGGFKIALIARLSAIPGHFTTAVFSTCGMGIFVFSLAAILSMPKQFITVYLGVILAQSSTGVKDTKSTIISDVVLAITVIITIAAMWYILRQMNLVKPQVIYERRKARQGKLARADFSTYFPGPSTDVFNPNISDSDIPLKPTNPLNAQYQQWDKQGNAVGYVADPQLIHTPKPRTGGAAFLPSKLARDVEEGITRPLTTREDSAEVVEWDMDQRKAGLRAEMGQTPTQASFPKDWSSHPDYRPADPSPFEEAYGGYEDPYSRGHAYEPTDSTFRTAFSSSPVHDEHLASRSAQGPAQTYSPPPPGSTNLR